MFPISFAWQAEADANEAVEWYDEKVDGLGLRFIEDLHQTVRSIQRNPDAQNLYLPSVNIRTRILNRFPYKVFFICSKDEIFVIAVIHQKRSPKYISRRLK